MTCWIMPELQRMTICFCHEWGGLPIISRVTKSRVNIIGKSHHEWPKIGIHGNEYTNLFLTRFYVLKTRFRSNNHWSLILPLSPRTVFSDLALWRHNNWSVTSRELALWRHIRRFFLHVQIGANAIFTSELQSWISIYHHLVFTA